jgi:hypothetical protein
VFPSHVRPYPGSGPGPCTETRLYTVYKLCIVLTVSFTMQTVRDRLVFPGFTAFCPLQPRKNSSKINPLQTHDYILAVYVCTCIITMSLNSFYLTFLKQNKTHIFTERYNKFPNKCPINLCVIFNFYISNASIHAFTLRAFGSSVCDITSSLCEPNRIQYVRYGPYGSSPYFIRPGVSPGSTLGPLLFTILSNDLDSSLTFFRCLISQMMLKSS